MNNCVSLLHSIKTKRPNRIKDETEAVTRQAIGKQKQVASTEENNLNIVYKYQQKYTVADVKRIDKYITKAARLQKIRAKLPSKLLRSLIGQTKTTRRLKRKRQDYRKSSRKSNPKTYLKKIRKIITKLRTYKIKTCVYYILTGHTKRIFSKYKKYSKHERALAKRQRSFISQSTSKSSLRTFILEPINMSDQTPSSKRPRSPEPKPGPSKKPCDPREEAAAPFIKDLPFGKRAAQKATVPPPTEAQKEQMEAIRRAQEEHKAQAEHAAKAKAAKEAAEAAETEPENETFDFNGNNHSGPGSQAAYKKSIDMMFVFYLGNDPYKALKIARNKDEILEAKKAIDELEVVSLNTHAIKLTQTNTHPTHSPTYKQVRQSTRASLTSSIDLTAKDGAETDELPDIEPAKKTAKKTRITAPIPPKTAGFVPSSAKRGRGRGRGAARGSTRGRGAKSGTGTRTRKPKTSETFDENTASAPVESEGESEDGRNEVDLARARKVINKKQQGAAVEGEVEELHQVIQDADCRAPDPIPAPVITVKDVMPRGKSDQVDRNPDMVVNIKGNLNCVDFILIPDVKVLMPNGRSKGMSLPTEQVFREVVNRALTNTVSIDMGWCNVITRRGVNRLGIGIIQINYGYPDAAAIFRDRLAGQSTDMVSYNTYPAVDILKKYGITVFFHAGFKGIPTHLLGGGLKGGNPDMKGDIKIVESRTLKFEDREECRPLSLDCSEEFLQYLATKTRNHKYNVYRMKVYINGGKRSDSQSEYNAPVLDAETSTKIVQSNSGVILQHSAARLGYQKEFNHSTRYTVNKSLY